MRRTLWPLVLLLVLVPGGVRAQNPILLGIYPWGDSLPETVVNIDALDAWIAPTGRRIGLMGDFFDPEYAPFLSVPLSMETAWANGRIPFAKLLPAHSAADIAAGAVDGALAQWGQSFAEWSQGGTKRAFVAPLPEMNGNWTLYHDKPEVVIQAYRRIRSLIRAELQAANVPLNAISWVFAPNGPSEVGAEFERYYPGHDEADVVGFSAYNWGGCPPAAQWPTYKTMFEPLLRRMLAMAPGKPIFITETAVIDRRAPTVQDRNLWLRDTYTRLAGFPRLRGVLYFDQIMPTLPSLPNCPDPDFRIHLPNTNEWHGFKDAMADPTLQYGYWAPTSPEVADIVFAPTVPHVFDDVHPIHPFAREPGDIDYSPWIHALAASGITTGCAAGPPLFCPTGGVTRDQMAVFLLRGIHGADFTPPPATGTIFADVDAANAFAPWIEQLAADGLTTGCGGGDYCPDGVVTREQMAVFLLRAIYGPEYTPGAATGTVFGDVPASSLFAAWIEQLAANGITGGCGDGNFCPGASITRQQMAVFLVRAFNLGP